ncbi:MAG: hypothetical protein U0575_09360 [Phycisphaerales bacterium]
MNDLRPSTDRSGHEMVRVDLKVGDLDQLFEPLDPAPMERRRLGRDVDRYIREAFVAAPGQESLELAITCPARSAPDGERAAEAVRRHYVGAATDSRHRLRSHLLAGTWQMLIGLVLIALLIGLARTIAGFSQSKALATIADGITIVIWVILWRPTEMLLFDWYAILRESRMLERLASVRVRFMESTEWRETNQASP